MFRQSVTIIKRLFLASAILVSALSATTSFAQDQDGVSYASVIMYHRFGEDRYPSTNTTIEQLEAHIAYLQDGNYNIMPLQGSFIAFNPAKPSQIKQSLSQLMMPIYRFTKQAGLISKTNFSITLFVATGPIDRNCAAIWIGIKFVNCKPKG